MLRDLFSLFPAYAGVILTAALRRTLQKTFPRIRGGDPISPQYNYCYIDFSPHTRG